MIAFDEFTSRLNASPIIWTLGLGVTVYFCAFWLAVLGMFARFPSIFEVGFLTAGSLVTSYHWAMSRYLVESKLAQFIHLSFGLALVSASMALIGAATHIKSYDWLTQFLFL